MLEVELTVWSLVGSGVLQRSGGAYNLKLPPASAVLSFWFYLYIFKEPEGLIYQIHIVTIIIISSTFNKRYLNPRLKKGGGYPLEIFIPAAPKPKRK